MRISDWSSDVCSSDLGQTTLPGFTDFSPDEIRMEFSGLVQHAFGTELARLRSMSRIERAVAFDAISVMDHLRHRGFSERVIALLTVGVFPRDITLGSQIGSASCRERVGQSVEISGVAG